MLSVQKLETDGYLKFIDSFKVHKDLSSDPYKGTWQKCIKDKVGKKYFINIEMWDFANSSFGDRNLGREPSFQANVQFTLANGDNINVEYLSVTNKTVIEIEEYFERLWRTQECRYYEKYNQD